MTDRDKTNNMVLQTMAYKLKNHFYESIDQFVQDFRKIFYNSKLNNSVSIVCKFTKINNKWMNYFMKTLLKIRKQRERVKVYACGK